MTGSSNWRAGKSPISEQPSQRWPEKLARTGVAENLQVRHRDSMSNSRRTLCDGLSAISLLPMFTPVHGARRSSGREPRGDPRAAPDVPPFLARSILTGSAAAPSWPTCGVARPSPSRKRPRTRITSGTWSSSRSARYSAFARRVHAAPSTTSTCDSELSTPRRRRSPTSTTPARSPMRPPRATNG